MPRQVVASLPYVCGRVRSHNRYGLHETLEAVRRDCEDGSGLYRQRDLTELAVVRRMLESALHQGLRYGMPMRATFVESK